MWCIIPHVLFHLANSLNYFKKTYIKPKTSQRNIHTESGPKIYQYIKITYTIYSLKQLITSFWSNFVFIFFIYPSIITDSWRLGKISHVQLQSNIYGWLKTSLLDPPKKMVFSNKNSMLSNRSGSNRKATRTCPF